MNCAPELELAQVAGQTLLAVRLHVVLQVRLDLEALAALLADEGAGGVRVDPQHVPLRLRLRVEVPPAHRALVVVLGLGAAGTLLALARPVVLGGGNSIETQTNFPPLNKDNPLVPSGHPEGLSQ